MNSSSSNSALASASAPASSQEAPLSGNAPANTICGPPPPLEESDIRVGAVFFLPKNATLEELWAMRNQQPVGLNPLTVYKSSDERNTCNVPRQSVAGHPTVVLRVLNDWVVVATFTSHHVKGFPETRAYISVAPESVDPQVIWDPLYQAIHVPGVSEGFLFLGETYAVPWAELQRYHCTAASNQLLGHERDQIVALAEQLRVL